MRRTSCQTTSRHFCKYRMVSVSTGRSKRTTWFSTWARCTSTSFARSSVFARTGIAFPPWLMPMTLPMTKHLIATKKSKQFFFCVHKKVVSNRHLFLFWFSARIASEPLISILRSKMAVLPLSSRTHKPNLKFGSRICHASGSSSQTRSQTTSV